MNNFKKYEIDFLDFIKKEDARNTWNFLTSLDPKVSLKMMTEYEECYKKMNEQWEEIFI